MTTDETGTTIRREYLLTAARSLGGTVTTSQALQIYAASPWHTVSRSTARRDLRDLARRAHLVPVDVDGARAYVPGDDPSPVHPMIALGGTRRFLLEAIRREGGEWTAGRAKRASRRIAGTHVWRATARRYLAELHRLGHLECHGDGTPRHFYTLRQEGGTA